VLQKADTQVQPKQHPAKFMRASGLHQRPSNWIRSASCSFVLSCRTGRV